MIITVPQYKKLNESFFDELEDDVFDTEDTVFNQINQISTKEYEENILKPQVEKQLELWDITKYDLECTGNGIVVNVHDHLNLSNKKLYKYSFKQWRFGIVDGNVYYSNNKLTNWNAFPLEIKGNCYANNNKIKNFLGAPIVHKLMDASKQLVKTDYPLTLKNYNNRYNHTISENSVYIISKDKFGILKDINESKQYCVIKLQDGAIIKCKLNDVNCLSKISDLLI